MRDLLSKVAAVPGRIAKNTSAATRLSLVAVVVALVSLVITSLVGLQRGGDLAEEVLRRRIGVIAASRADEVERYVESLKRAAISQAISPSTADAIEQFSAAYRELQVEGFSMADKEAVDEFYTDKVAPELAEVRGRPVGASSLVPSDPAAVYLQAKYVVPVDENEGLIADAGDGSRWSELHSSLHRAFTEVAIQTGVDDFYLIEPENNTIVYSTAKNIDFGTSLLIGPQSGTALAALINSFPRLPEPGVATITDYGRYTAAGDEPRAFIASPVITDGTLTGFVALGIGPDELSSITTADGSWQELGDSGETYLVAGDDLMRSDARGFIEDQDSYLQAASAAQTATDNQIRLMEALGTTALFQPAGKEDDIDAVLADLGEPRLVDTTNYLGRSVVSSQRALDIEGLDWALFAEIETQEVTQPIEDFVRNLLVAIAVFIVAVTFIAVRWSDRLLEPLRIIATRLREVRGRGDAELGSSSAAVPESSPTEFVELAEDIDTMLDTLAARNADAEERTAERRDLLRRILPPQVVRRAEAGERDVLDQVPQATVAVVLIRGLGMLMRAGSEGQARDLLDRFVEEADALAKQHGLDRIRLTGDAYFAASGTTRPHLDHAQRAVSFALDVRELVRDLAADHQQPITMSAGLDSGSVTVGLTGGSRLVYDSWGSAVRNAADLARRAGPGEVVITPATRSHLPASYLIEDYPGPVEWSGMAIVSGRMREGESSR